MKERFMLSVTDGTGLICHTGRYPLPIWKKLWVNQPILNSAGAMQIFTSGRGL